MNKAVLSVLGGFVACSVYEPALLIGPSAGNAGGLSGSGGDAGQASAGKQGGQGGSAAGASNAASGGEAGALESAGSTGLAGAGANGNSDAGAGGEGGELDSGGRGGLAGSAGNGGSSAGSAGSGAGGSAGGSAGSAGAGGTSAGVAGSLGNGGEPGTIELLLIDDFEDGDHQIALEGQVGYWYSYNDGTGTETPAPSDPFAPVTINPPIDGSSSTKAAHVRWQGFTVWGAGFGAAFTDDDSFYDASAYDGFTFWARIETGSETRVNMIVQERRSLDPACTVCGHHPLYALNLTTAWQRFYVPFALIQGDGGGDPSFVDLDPSGLYGIQFFRGGNHTIEIWVDDVSFYRVE